MGTATETQERTEDARWRRRRRWWVLVVLVLGIALTLGVTFSALSARRDLTAGERALREARAALVDGDAPGAAAGFREARTRFSSASDAAASPWMRVVGWVPLAGRTPDALVAIAEAGERVATAGGILATAVDELPGGLAALAPSGGRIAVEPYRRLGEAAAQARRETAAALATVQRAPRGSLLGPVAAAREDAEAEIASLDRTLDDATKILAGLPGFLGADGRRRYFFGAQNPAELRGTGGVIGAYSILTVDDGRFGFSRFEPVQSLPVPDLADVPPPSAEYAENYNAFRTEGRFWLAINLTPDFPTAATAILNAYEVAEGERLDGVILADPFALEALLKVTGPAFVPGLDRTIGPGQVVSFTTNGAYAIYPDQPTRKRVLGAVAEAAFGRFLARSGTDVEDLRVLARAAAQGHVLLYSRDGTFQQGIAGTGAGGALRGGGTDVLSVVENSAGGTKVDFYEDREISYDVELWDRGAAQASVEVRLTNGAPTSGMPRYVIGPQPGFAEAGEGAQLVSIFCDEGCRLQAARRGGEEVALWSGTELGLPFYQDYFRTSSGETDDLSVRLYLPSAWEGDATGGAYRLSFLNQTTIRPAELTVRVKAPPGMRIVATDPEMRIEGDTATWSGTPTRTLELSVRFEPPLLVRWWRGLTT